MSQPLTPELRAAFATELLQLWEESAKQMEIDECYTAASEIKTAISVLEMTFSGSELGIASEHKAEPGK